MRYLLEPCAKNAFDVSAKKGGMGWFAFGIKKKVHDGGGSDLLDRDFEQGRLQAADPWE